jgi:outer membrane usher protein
VQAGLVRQNWGVISNDYEHLASIATYRRGLSQWLTVEGSAEGTGGTAMAGGGVVVNVDNIAVLNTSVAASGGSGGSGRQYAIGLQRTGLVFSVGASATAADHGFRDIAAMSGDPVPRLQLSANFGVSLGQFGSAGIAYSAIDNDVVSAPIQLYVPPGTILPTNTIVRDGVAFLQPAQHAHVGTVSYSAQVFNVSVFATAFRDFASGGTSGVLFGLTIPLGARSSGGLNAGSGSSGGYQQLQVQQSVTEVGDWGYQAFGATGDPAHEFGQVQYKSPWALLTAGADHVGSQTTLRTEAQGAVSYVDGGVFPSNTINDSFGVVDTDGLANVRVLYENRLVGRTNNAGLLLVPDLRSFDVNHLAIDPNDIPLDTTVGAVTRTVRPQDRSGVVIKFGVKVSHGALLRLADAAGLPLPVGSVATLKATGTAYPVGYDGEAYVEDLASHNELAVQRPNGQRCSVGFDYHTVKGTIPTIGPLRCGNPTP